MATVTVPAEPYEFTFDPATSALMCIDFQRDFMEPGGFGESLGNDVSTLRQAIEPTQAVLAAFRERGWTVIHTREGHRDDLGDLFPAKQNRGKPSLRIGDEGPMGRLLVRGSAGHEIIPELAPLAGRDRDRQAGKGIVLLDGPRHRSPTPPGSPISSSPASRPRSACSPPCARPMTAATNASSSPTAPGSYFPEFHQSALDMFKAQGGIVGWVATSSDLLRSLG